MILDSFLLSSASSQQGFTGFPAGGSPNSIYFFLAFIAVIATLRIYRGINGRVYSQVRVLRLPVVYVILTLVIILFFDSFNLMLVATLGIIPLGFLLGYVYGTRVKFFSRNNVVYYTRSPVIMVVWLVSYVGRMVIAIVVSPSFTVLFIFDALLCATTGLLIGEALNIMRKRREYVEPRTDQNVQDESFRIDT